jgi:hypothetical protein
MSVHVAEYPTGSAEYTITESSREEPLRRRVRTETCPDGPPGTIVLLVLIRYRPGSSYGWVG